MSSEPRPLGMLFLAYLDSKLTTYTLLAHALTHHRWTNKVQPSPRVGIQTQAPHTARPPRLASSCVCAYCICVFVCIIQFLPLSKFSYFTHFPLYPISPFSRFPTFPIFHIPHFPTPHPWFCCPPTPPPIFLKTIFFPWGAGY